MKKITVSILTTLLMLSMVFSSSVFAAEKVSVLDSFLGIFNAKTAATSDVGVEYRGHIQNIGNYPLDGSWIQGPTELGTEGKSLRLEGFWIQLNGDDVPTDAHIEYQVHVQNVGWMDPVQDGDFAGTEGKSQQIEAIKISLVDDEGVQLEDYSVVYTGHVQNKGDVGPYTNGEQLGTDGEFLRLEAITVEIVQNEADLTEYEEALAAVTQADYTAASWTAYQAVVNANVVDEDNLQSEVDAATAAIEAAQANLVEVLKVESVSAINAKQVQVVFTTPVDATTAKDVTNYAFRLAGGLAGGTSLTANALATGATSELSADAKTLTITLAAANSLTTATNPLGAALASGDQFQVITQNVKDAAKVQTVAKTTNTVTFTDTIKPEFVSATASAKTSTNTIKLTFSEPVTTVSATVTINGTAASLSAGANPNEITVTSGTNLVAGTTYTLSLLNFKDYAGNFTATNPIATTVTVSADTVAPTITSVTVIGDNTVEVAFDKAMSTGTLTTGTVKFLDPNLSPAGTATPAVKANTTDNKTFTITISGVTFNTAGTFTGVLSFTDGVKDASGNAIVPVTKPVTLVKETAKPTVVSSSYKNLDTYGGQTNTAKGFIVVKFNKAVTASAAFGAYTVLNDLGVSVATPISARAINTSDNTELVLSLNAPVATTDKSYTLIMPASAVVDTSSTPNASASVNLMVDVKAGPPVAADLIKPILNTATETAATTATTGTTIALAFTEGGGSGLNPSTVIDTNNYRLDGAPLPSGSYVEVTAATTATIHIPAATIAKSKNYSLNVAGIADKAGNVMDPFVKTTVALVDDVKPVLTSGAVNTGGTISLGFSETMRTAASKEAGLALRVNGSAAFTTGANQAYTLADGIGADAGKYVVTVKKSTQKLAMTSNSLTVNGVTYTNATYATSQVKFDFIDVDASNTYNTGDILILATDTNTNGSSDATLTADGNYDLNNASSITVTSTGTTIADASVINTNTGNLLTGSTVITVK